MNADRSCGAQLSQDPQKAPFPLQQCDHGKRLPFPGTLRAIWGRAPLRLCLHRFIRGQHLIFPTPGHKGVRNNKSEPEISIPSSLRSHPALITLHEPSSFGRPALSDFLFQLDKLIFQATFELRKVWGIWRNPLLKNAKSFYLFFLTLLSYNLLLLGALSSLTKNQYPLHICKVLSGGKSATCPSQ